MRFNMLRLVVRLAFSALMTGNLTLKLADAHDRPLFDLQHETSISNCWMGDLPPGHAWYSRFDDLDPSSIGHPARSAAAHPAGPVWTIALQGYLAFSDEIHAATDRLDSFADQLQQLSRPAARFAMELDTLLGEQASASGTLRVYPPVAGTPPTPRPTIQQHAFQLLPDESYQPYDLSVRDWHLHVGHEALANAQDFCGPRPRDFYVARAEVDAATVAQAVNQLYGRTKAAEYCPRPELSSTQSGFYLDRQSMNDAAYSAGEQLHHWTYKAHGQVAQWVIACLPPTRVQPLMVGPQFVLHRLDDGTEMWVDLKLAQEWSLIRKIEAARIVPSYCPLADYSRACVTRILQRGMQDSRQALQAWGLSPTSSEGGKYIAAAVQWIR